MSIRDQFMIETSFLETDAWTAASHSTRGIWLQLHAAMTMRMCGDTLDGCADWTAKVWRERTKGLIKPNANALVTAGLARWEGASLVLFGYDSKGESIFLRQSKGGRTGAIRRWCKEERSFSPGINGFRPAEDDDGSHTET